MLYFLPFPGIRDVNFAVFCLNDCWIREFLTGFIFQSGDVFPDFPITGNGYADRRAASFHRIVNNNMSAILQRDGIRDAAFEQRHSGVLDAGELVEADQVVDHTRDADQPRLAGRAMTKLRGEK